MNLLTIDISTEMVEDLEMGVGQSVTDGILLKQVRFLAKCAV